MIDPAKKAAQERKRVRKAERRLLTAGEVRARVAVPKRLPSHIGPFADFMRRAAAEPPTARKIVKAYALTRSSVARAAVPRPTICESYPEFRELRRFAQTTGEAVRPEDAMSILLFSPHGRKYLNAAGKGVFDETAAEEMVRRSKCFGLQNTLRSDLRRGVELAAKHGPELRRALKGSREEWLDFVRANVHGISSAKAGFFAALFGRGDLPTFDAREIDIWRRNPKKRTVRKADVLALTKKIRDVPIVVRARDRRNREHLVHHALWDAKGGTRTTHASMAHAMQFAGVKSGR